MTGVCYDLKEEAVGRSVDASAILVPTAVILLLIIIIISVLAFPKRRKKRHIYIANQTDSHSKNGYDDINPYDEIPAENLELSVIRGQEIHYLLPIPEEDSTGPQIHIGNDTHTNIQRENLARPLPNPNGVSRSDDGNTNPDLTYLTVVGNDYFEPYSTIPNRNMEQMDAIELLSQAHNAVSNDYLELDLTTPKSTAEQIEGIDHLSQEPEADRHDYFDAYSTKSKRTAD